MIFAIASFVLSIAAVLGIYWAFVVRPETQEKERLTGRLKTFRVKTANVAIVSADGQTHVPGLSTLIGRSGRLTAPLDRLIVESGLRLTVSTLLLMMLLGATLGVVLGWWMARLAASAFFAVLFGIAPYWYVRYKRGVRLRLFEEQFPEAVELIARSLRAGHAFTTGLGMAADEIPQPVGTEFKRVYDEQNFGMSLPDALRGMAKRVPVLDARFFVTAVLTQRESGGNLSEVLDNLANVMRERFKVKRQIRVISAHGRISAWVLSCLAPTLALILFLLSPSFMSTLWEDPLGIRLVMVAVTLQIVGTIIISRMVRIEY
ncbi:MAG: type II secretion system F family protein [Acidobacteriota bacterium]